MEPDMGSENLEHVPTRLNELAARYGLAESQRGQLAALLTVLAEDELAPTAVRAPTRALDVHLADSLVALESEPVRMAHTIADLGAGAGFPGLPLAVAVPASEVTLLDSQARKCAFIERLRGAARIENARTVCTRVEEWPEGIEQHDVVLARALAAQPVVLEYAAPLLRVGGTLIDWRGRRDAGEEARASAAAEELHLRRIEIRHVEPYAGALQHNLHLYLKVGPSPDRFPRRSGVARKRPLGGSG